LFIQCAKLLYKRKGFSSKHLSFLFSPITTKLNNSKLIMTRSKEDSERIRQDFRSLISRASEQPSERHSRNASNNPSRNPSKNTSRNPSRNPFRNPFRSPRRKKRKTAPGHYFRNTSRSPSRSPFRSPRRRKQTITKQDIELINGKLDRLLAGQKRLEERVTVIERTVEQSSNTKDKDFVNVIKF